MITIPTEIPGLLILEPKVFGDDRGYFFEAWNKNEFAMHGIHHNFVQDNISKSCAGVVRGLHYQLPPYTQSKIVRVISGRVLDVAVDLRKGSPAYGKHVTIELSEENKRAVFIPRGLAHGFAVLSDEAIFSYKCDNIYMPSHERGIAFDDPELGIDWQLGDIEAILSEKDKKNPSFSNAEIPDSWLMTKC
ncbi:MAG: dTDP-4-dehydrorhamnose 3,5-epimerase [Lentisphaerae bacterium]|nr:dTDP-4-dehydrorhamnose 3,5-epimerase [Lentisphaerota bacterium]